MNIIIICTNTNVPTLTNSYHKKKKNTRALTNILRQTHTIILKKKLHQYQHAENICILILASMTMNVKKNIFSKPIVPNWITTTIIRRNIIMIVTCHDEVEIYL